MEENINNINKELWKICKEHNIEWPANKKLVVRIINTKEESLVIAVKKHKDEIAKSSLFPSEQNLNKLGIFTLSKPKRKFEFVKKVVNSTGESVAVELKYKGWLGASELRVWLVFQYLYNEQMQNNRERFIEDGKRIPFTYAQICRLLKIEPKGENLQRIRDIIKNLEYAKIEIENFYNKGKNQYKTLERFSIFPHSWNVWKLYGKKDKRDFHYIVINDFLMENLDNGYFITFNFDKLINIKKPIALGLYLKLSSSFYGSPTKQLYIKYETLCNYCRIPICKSNYYINRQFNPALDELVRIRFLAKYEWEDEGKKHVGIKFYPGDLYWADREKRITSG